MMQDIQNGVRLANCYTSVIGFVLFNIQINCLNGKTLKVLIKFAYDTKLERKKRNTLPGCAR